MIEQSFYDYVSKFGVYQKRSMFGGIGLFQNEAMYSLLKENKIFVRGGGRLDSLLINLRCEKYKHIKKQSTTTVNYYDVTQLFISKNPQLDSIFRDSIDYSLQQRNSKKSQQNKRLRDLPNLNLMLERMAKKVGIDDIDTFLEVGAVTIFERLQTIYGNDLDRRVLLKFIGASEGMHWQLVEKSKENYLTE